MRVRVFLDNQGGSIMKKLTNIALLLAVMVLGFSLNSQAISLTVGDGDFYVNVGDTDYLPYSYQYGGSQFPNLSFQSAMGDYGSWVGMQPFGQVWRPYVANDWRPYTNGHWVYTQYGPTWQGYEPWAWAGYHYGNWVFSRDHGWVWIPGYEYHSGRVAWSHGINSIGWMPLPPSGYDYSRGYLSHIGAQNQFTYIDDDFSVGFGFGGGNDYYYGGPYYDPRYRNMYYNQSYLNVAGLLWTFLDPDHFTSDNYADYYYGGDYARYLFDRRLVRISTRPLDRVVVERVVRRQIPVRRVRTNDVQIDGRRVRIAAIEGEEETIRRNANKTVREVIAPAFAEKGKNFKGENARNRAGITKALKLENTPKKVRTVTSEEIVREARQKTEQRETRRTQARTRKQQEVAQVEKQGKVKEKKDRAVRETGTENERSRSTRVPPGQERNRPAEVQQQDDDNQQKRNQRAIEAQEQKEQQQRRRPATEQEEQERRRRPNTESVPPSDDEDVRTKDMSRRPAARPESDTDVQSDIERERNAREAEVRKNEQPEQKAKSKAETEKEKKAKAKKAQDKDKNKKQNQDDEPPKE
jgi:hypothetical protein